MLVLLLHVGDRLILFPSTEPIDAQGATRFSIPFEGGNLEIVRALVGESKAFVLRFYGNADRGERWVAGEAAQWPGVEFWSVNYPGYGASTGPARLVRLADAALTAYDAMRTQAGERPTFVFGTSIGTTAALHVAAEREVKGLLLQNPPPLRQLIMGQHGWWNLWILALPIALQLPASLDSLENARRARSPAVFVLASDDEVVPHKYHRLIADTYAGPKEVLIQKGAQHNTPFSPEFAMSVHDALGRLLPR